MNPFLIRSGTAVQHVLLVWARQIGVERHIEGQIDGVAGYGWVGTHAGAAGDGALVGLGHHVVVCLRVRARHAEAHGGGRHSIGTEGEAMPLGEVLDSVHARRPSCTAQRRWEQSSDRGEEGGQEGWRNTDKPRNCSPSGAEGDGRSEE